MRDPTSDTGPPFNPYLALLIGTLAVSTGAVFARLADAPALVIAAFRSGLATLILAPVAWWKSRDDIKKLSGHDLKLALISGFFLALHFATWISPSKAGPEPPQIARPEAASQRKKPPSFEFDNDRWILYQN